MYRANRFGKLEIPSPAFERLHVVAINPPHHPYLAKFEQYERLSLDLLNVRQALWDIVFMPQSRWQD